MATVVAVEDSAGAAEEVGLFAAAEDLVAAVSAVATAGTDMDIAALDTASV